MCKRVELPDSAASRLELRGVVRSPPPHLRIDVIKLAMRIYDHFCFPARSRESASVLRPLIEHIEAELSDLRSWASVGHNHVVKMNTRTERPLLRVRRLHGDTAGLWVAAS